MKNKVPPKVWEDKAKLRIQLNIRNLVNEDLRVRSVGRSAFPVYPCAAALIELEEKGWIEGGLALRCFSWKANGSEFRSWHARVAHPVERG